jgi:hypothetical protein
MKLPSKDLFLISIIVIFVANICVHRTVFPSHWQVQVVDVLERLPAARQSVPAVIRSARLGSAQRQTRLEPRQNFGRTCPAAGATTTAPQTRDSTCPQRERGPKTAPKCPASAYSPRCSRRRCGGRPPSCSRAVLLWRRRSRLLLGMSPYHTVPNSQDT